MRRIPVIKGGARVYPQYKELNKKVAAARAPPDPLLAWGVNGTLEPPYKVNISKPTMEVDGSDDFPVPFGVFLKWTSRNHFQGCKTIDRWSSITNQRILSWYVPSTPRYDGRRLGGYWELCQPKIAGWGLESCGTKDSFLQKRMAGEWMWTMYCLEHKIFGDSWTDSANG